MVFYNSQIKQTCAFGGSIMRNNRGIPSPSLLILLTCFLVAQMVHGAVAISLANPPVGGAVEVLDAFSTDDNLVLERSAEGVLCMLWHVSSSSSSANQHQQRKPVARSYLGYDWESYAGDFSNLQFVCQATTCSTSQLSGLNEDNASYELRCVQHSLQPQDEIARFLEQATFGPTRESIAALASSADSSSTNMMFAKWVQRQLVDVPATSHRRYFRERWTHRTTVPSHVGVPTHACAAGARYRQYAFSDMDRGRLVELRTVIGRKVFLVDGQARTAVTAKELYVGDPRRTKSKLLSDGFYEICTPGRLAVVPAVGSKFKLAGRGIECDDVYFDGVKSGNPAVYFDLVTPPTNPPVPLDGNVVPVDEPFYKDDAMQEVSVQNPIAHVSCDAVPNVTGVPAYTVVGTYNSKFWLFDPRLVLFENTITAPKEDGGRAIVDAVGTNTAKKKTRQYDALCSNVPRNFMNEDSCFLANNPNNTCSVVGGGSSAGGGGRSSIKVPLTLQNIARVYRAIKGKRTLYAITGLRQDPAEEQVPYDPPCTTSTKSRWIPIERCSSNKLAGTQTQMTFARLIRNSLDTNPNMRDVFTPALGELCDVTDRDQYNFQVMVDGQCYQNVHLSHLQVYDFTRWIRKHPGGRAAIATNARSGTFTLDFPPNHAMSRWYDNMQNKKFENDVGRLGDEVDLEMPDRFSEELGSVAVKPTGVICGSRNEAANAVERFGSFNRGGFDGASQFNETTPSRFLMQQRLWIWLAIALGAEDQIRQKTAFALSQICVISPFDIDKPEATESFLSFYDIFVRNAFGSYLDVLKEISYSALMGTFLSYLDSTSIAYSWERFARIEFPDENFARELMQLFSIGLVMMNDDGTPVLKDGKPIKTYTNDDITEYARLWTGFQMQKPRGNIESPKRNWNRIDPMIIDIERRDRFPKMGLNKWYIGDGVPLCVDLPDQAFLKKGATYRLLGTIPSPTLLSEPDSWATSQGIRRLRLSSSSALFETLCNRVIPGVGDCRYSAKVELDRPLACTGDECDIESPRVIEVEPGLFYEYDHMPCVHQAFYSDAKTLKNGEEDYFCGDPRSQTGALVCCNSASNEASHFGLEAFTGERLSFQAAEQRCNYGGLTLCKRPRFGRSGDDNEDDADDAGRWTSQSCDLAVKIDIEGNVAIVHSIPDPAVDPTSVSSAVREDTKTFFRVDWGASPIDELLGDYAAKCQELGCRRDSFDNLCLCAIDVQEEQVFSSSPAREDVLNRLHVGAFSPYEYGEGMSMTDLGGGVRMHSVTGQFSGDSIFEVLDENGVTHFRKNLQSIVFVGRSDVVSTKSSLTLSFRNPPHFIALSNPDLLSAHYETDAGLQHYFYHPNTAPFLAIRFSQRFGISNPSPRYVKAMAAAFRTGTFTDSATNTVFGTGNYGDLGALVAALLLDREARSVILDADPAHGSMLEPFSKLVRLMRSLEFKSDPDHPFVQFGRSLQEGIGQQPHAIPNVFSFFLPEFSPAGPVGEASLVCPECQVWTGPKSITLMNGLLSLIKYGLDNAYKGFGIGRGGKEENRKIGNTRRATGELTYSPQPQKTAPQAIDELATLLTSGRLSQDKRDDLERVTNEAIARGERQLALLNVEQLIMLTPEFHTNGLSQNGEAAPSPLDDEEQDSSTSYKAVIYVMLDGGYDSFNMLVPNVCQGKNAAGVTVDEQYKIERGAIGFTDEERSLTIDIDAGVWNQPCSQFALHDELTVIKELFDDGDLTFFANTGILSDSGMTKSNYKSLSEVQLFSHNSMQRETKTVDPKSEQTGTGVLGRLAQVLAEEKKYKTSLISIDSNSVAVTPKPGTGAPDPLIISREGVTKFDPSPETASLDTERYAFALNGKGAAGTTTSVYGETFSQQFTTAIRQANKLQGILDAAELGPHWPNSSDADGDEYERYNNQLAEQFQMVAKLIQTRDARKSDRDFYYTNSPGWDHHSNLKERLRTNFVGLNQGLALLVEELKNQGVWNDVVIVVASDFGRTITPNTGQGTDHAWGNHYFMMGGSVAGGGIRGEYPSDITQESPLNVGRGRIMPTTSWDAIWNGVSEWMGATSDSELDYCLPNRHSATALFGSKDLFGTKSPAVVGGKAMSVPSSSFSPAGLPLVGCLLLATAMSIIVAM